MAVTRAYNRLGKIKNKIGQDLDIWLGRYTAEAGDLYDQDARPTLTFNGLSRILDDYDGTTHAYGVLALYADGVTALSNAPVFVSVTNAAAAAPILTFGVLENTAAGAVFAEKTDDEGYGRAVDFYALVIGY